MLHALIMSGTWEYPGRTSEVLARIAAEYRRAVEERIRELREQRELREALAIPYPRILDRR